MKPQKPKDLEVAFEQPTCKLAKELEKEKNFSDENKKLRKENSRLKQSNKEKDITIENCRARNLTKTNKIKHLKRLVRGESKPAGHQFSRRDRRPQGESDKLGTVTLETVILGAVIVVSPLHGRAFSRTVDAPIILRT